MELIIEIEDEFGNKVTAILNNKKYSPLEGIKHVSEVASKNGSISIDNIVRIRVGYDGLLFL